MGFSGPIKKKRLILFPGSHPACKIHLHKSNIQHLLPWGNRVGFHVHQEPGGPRFSFSSSSHEASALPAPVPIYREGYYDHYHAVCEKGEKIRVRWKEQRKGFSFWVCHQVAAWPLACHLTSSAAVEYASSTFHLRGLGKQTTRAPLCTVFIIKITHIDHFLTHVFISIFSSCFCSWAAL